MASEFHKSNQALNVHYTVKRGTEIIKWEGICKSEVVLLEENGFHTLDKNKYAILEVKPEQIDKELFLRNSIFLKFLQTA